MIIQIGPAWVGRVIARWVLSIIRPDVSMLVPGGAVVHGCLIVVPPREEWPEKQLIRQREIDRVIAGRPQ